MADPSSRPYEGTGGIATGAPGDHSTTFGGLEAMHLTPTCGDTCQLCRRRACQVTDHHDDHVCFPCEQQLLRQRHRQTESESGSFLKLMLAHLHDGVVFDRFDADIQWVKRPD